MKLPDIVVFGFNRPDLLERCLAALGQNTLAQECILTVYCDGPRNEKDLHLVEATRKIARAAKGFKSLTVIERQENYGCAASIIAGITQSFENNDSLAIFEDDILASPHTLSFLAACLGKYARTRSVFSISAWSPPPTLLSISKTYPFDAYCIPRCNIWGWATWKDRWQSIDWSIVDYAAFAENPNLRHAFNSGGNDMTHLLEAQMAGKLDAWDIRMDYSRFKQGCVGINPVISYTTNIGMGSGTHTTVLTTRYDNDISKAIPNPRLPDHIFVDKAILPVYQKIYATPPLWVRCVNKAARMTIGRNLIRY